MFGLGTGEILLILIVILLLFGATRVPALLGGLGKGVKEFKKSMRDDEPSTKAATELAVELRADIGKRAVLLPDGTLEVGGDTGAFLKEVDGEWATLQDDVMTAKLSLASVKKVVRRT